MKKLTFDDVSNLAASRSTGAKPEISIESDVSLVPAQFYGVLAGHRPRFENERNLMCAVLEDAIRCYVDARESPLCDKEPEMAELKRWFAERHSRHPFSFEHICEYLDLDPECIRRLLKALATREPLAPRYHRRPGSCARSVKLPVHHDRQRMKPPRKPHA